VRSSFSVSVNLFLFIIISLRHDVQAWPPPVNVRSQHRSSQQPASLVVNIPEGNEMGYPLTTTVLSPTPSSSPSSTAMANDVPSYEEVLEADEPPPSYLEAISLEIFDE